MRKGRLTRHRKFFHTETMDVHLKPEQEAFIQGRVREGRFASANDALREAVALLQQAEQHREEDFPPTASEFRRQARTGKDLIAIMQACPFPDVDLEPVRTVMPVRDSAF